MIRPLLLLELRRQRAAVLRMVMLTVVVEAVFFAAGKRSPDNLLASLLGCCIGVVLIIPMGISRDKMEGTLDFICGLPVEARDIAASRFAALAVLTIPWAVAVGALATRVPQSAALSPAGVVVLAWLTMLSLGSIATALFICFDLETLLGAPVVGLIIAVVLIPRIARALLPQVTAELLLRFLSGPSAPLILAAVLLLVAGGVTTASFALSVRALGSVSR